MALADETPRILHVGNGTRGPFSLSVGGTPITFPDSDHIVVQRFDDDGVATSLTEGLHYDLSATEVMPDVGEQVQTVTAATLTLKLTEDVLAVDEHILVERITPTQQDTVLTTGGGFSSAVGEKTFDYFMRLGQELRAALRRVIALNPLDEDGPYELGTAADRAGKIIAFDDDGAMEFIDPPEDGAVGPQGPTGATGATGNPGASGDGSGDVVGPATNTADTVPLWNGTNSKVLKNATAAQGRTALGLGSAALLASSAVFQVANNLSEGNASSMRSNLGLGTAALLASGAVLQTANNLSDLASAATARTNLGLGSIATLARASTAEFLANTANRALSTDYVWAAGALVALTDAGTIAMNMDLGINFSLNTIGGNRTLGLPTNIKPGQSGVIYIVQDGTGGRTLAYHSIWKFAGGVEPVLSTPAGSTDLLHYHALSSGFIFASLTKAVG